MQSFMDGIQNLSGRSDVNNSIRLQVVLDNWKSSVVLVN